MRIQYASDLHREFGQEPLTPEDIVGDILVLAGDLVNRPVALTRYVDCLRKSHFWGPIILVLGNHEFYGHDWVTATAEYRAAVGGIPDVYLLEDASVVLGGVRFLGATLWTDFFGGTQGPQAARALNDFQVIRVGARTLHWHDVVQRHKTSLTWLTQELRATFDGPTVVVTHHAPSSRSNHPKYAASPISGGFYSNLDDLVLSTQPSLWIHGHTHDSFAYSLGTTPVVCNPFGYGVENAAGFDKNAVVTLAVAQSPDSGRGLRGETAPDCL